MIEYEITSARMDDAETLSAFNVALAAESESLKLDPSTVLAGVRALLQDESKGRYLVARPLFGAEQSKPVGQLMITVEWSDWRNRPLWWVQSVYVHPEHRRRGLFRRLFRTVLEQAKTAGVPSVRLYVERENDSARSTYTALGFKTTGYLVLERYV